MQKEADQNDAPKPAKAENAAEETLATLRQKAASISDSIKKLDADLTEKKKTRSALGKEFRAIIGKIETRVAAGEK